jgi:hypothetical protein
MPGEPPPDFVLNGVDLPGRTFVALQYSTIVLSFHPDDADDAARLAAEVQAASRLRTVTYEVR